MKAFYKILGNTLFASIINFFVWFALTFWLYLETKSVLATSFAGGAFMAAMALSGFWLGSIVDHNTKKASMIISTVATVVSFATALLIYMNAPVGAFSTVSSPWLWGVMGAILVGVIAGNIRGIVLPTLVTLLVPSESRDKANGLSGMVMGISSVGAGMSSGLVLAYAGMGWVLISAVVLSFLALIHIIMCIFIPGDIATLSGEQKRGMDVRGTIRIVKNVPGLFPLIFFTTFNNFLGGIFAALLDAYGLTLVSVQVWSIIWGVLSTGFIIGGLYIAKKGLGKDPLKRLFMINIVSWISCIFFTIQPSIWLLCLGILVWVILAPFIEATEHTIIQKVVPLERQGRVFGFAQSIEMAASPLTAFLIGPIAQFIFIPFMTTGKGVEFIGSWFGVGAGRGIAVVFTLAGILGLIVTLIAMRSGSYKRLGEEYKK